MDSKDADDSTPKEGSSIDHSPVANKVEIPCRIRVWDILMDDQPKDLSPDIEVPFETREKWIDGIKKAFNTSSGTLHCIRPWDITLYLDGGIAIKENVDTGAATEGTDVTLVYPVRYQIPSGALKNVTTGEQHARTETFALGCLVYEITTLSKPYANLTDDEVQRLYNKGKFPGDNSSLLEMSSDYIRANPIRFGFQVAGVTVVAGSLVALPILGALGFTTLGPAAGTAAAAWQSSLGIVQAGSLFAWCQSAAMGGAAVGGLSYAGAAGAGVAGAATVADIPGLKEKVAEAMGNVSSAVKDPGWQENVKGALKGAADAVTDPGWQEHVKGTVKGAAGAIADPGWHQKVMGLFKGSNEGDSAKSKL